MNSFRLSGGSATTTATLVMEKHQAVPFPDRGDRGGLRVAYHAGHRRIIDQAGVGLLDQPGRGAVLSFNLPWATLGDFAGDIADRVGRRAVHQGPSSRRESSSGSGCKGTKSLCRSR
ncbi:hypothetical protein ABB07_38375 [Streptomyces incarnatus]|uniref:Uncharacterized protein n=1 Tax=Streptomyces incarnatus TaxID=665007 RepID=A0ABM5TX46_9ACTN|nr:hypothetical protein ABB07_38375 [Streptomyces incarnatus]